MIARLRGRVIELDEGEAVVDVGGVGYLVACAHSTLARLTLEGACELFVETIVREESFALYGFLSRDDREWFRRLTSVQGVGAKVALAIQSVLTGEQLLLAISAEDKAMISRARGVGSRMAQRIVSELKDKAGHWTLVSAAPGGKASAPPSAPAGAPSAGADQSDARVLRDALSALVNLGFGRSEAQSVLARLLRDQPELKEGEAIRLALKQLSQRAAEG